MRLSIASRALIKQVWGSLTEQRRFYVRCFLQLLAKHGSFAWGGRVAYSIDSIARDVTCSRRTAQRIVSYLQVELSGLVTVQLVQPGELAWDGADTRREHYEFAIGAEWQRVVDGFLEAITPKSKAQTGRKKAVAKAVVASKAIRKTGLNSKGSVLSMGAKASLDYAQSTPDPNLNFSFRGDRAGSRSAGFRPLPKTRPAAVPVQVSEVTGEAIKQHRAHAESKGPAIPITRAEAELVETARATQPKMGDASWLALCRSVSALALEESRARGQATAALSFTFGGEDALYFRTRVAKLREREQAAKKQRHAEEHRAYSRLRGERGESEEHHRVRVESIARAGEGPDYEPPRAPTRPVRPASRLSRPSRLSYPSFGARPLAEEPQPQPQPQTNNPFYQYLLGLNEPQRLASLSLLPKAQRDETLRDLAQLQLAGGGQSQGPAVPAATPKPAPASPMDVWRQLPADERRSRMSSLSVEDRARALDELLEGAP